MSVDLRIELQQALANFVAQPLPSAANALLKTLGYASDRTVQVASVESFCAKFDAEKRLAHPSALRAEWKSIHLLFQLTDQELGRQNPLFKDTEVQPRLFESYIFFAVELTGSDYSRSKLTGIARQINRIFPMPVMVLIKHRVDQQPAISIVVINRRRNKVHQEKDVLEKAAIIRDISLTQPHRGHLEILRSLAMGNLVHPEKLPITNFDALHATWEQIFNVELLNQRFYRELASWYFWAMKHCHFPLLDEQADKYFLFKDRTKVREHEAKNLIRLLTRILFVWFIKQRGLVPDTLFDPLDLKRAILKTFDPESTDTHYYKAVLQNLFFATPNQTHGEREFRKEGQHQNTTTLLRYQEGFKSPQAFVDLLEKTTPFLNGGLFECLDHPHLTKKGSQGGALIIYEDGFSDRPDNPLHMPDFLFFGRERLDDLSGDHAYGEKKYSQEKVRGLIHILNSYKFTIVENTPIDQDIALDPELLGQVFENLLASYNPETKTSARKQTGSFYTPRRIVEYMVDEALKSHFRHLLVRETNMSEDHARSGLDLLFTYTERAHPFSAPEVTTLIRAIDNCKILDPACGSGAFPMGVLQKLVYILSKLDPDNLRWKQTQLDKLDSAPMRESLERDFADNDDDYGRKLYLIENCLYGVDIQSIATQVSKLRFFISLIVDQNVDRSKENFGVRPLPNLETKFVTADTLNSIERPTAQTELFDTTAVTDLQKQLKRVRHSLFSAKTPRTKNKHREEDKALREAIAVELENNGWESHNARALAAWDPYNQNASAAYFDPEWMFGEKVFDVVIGNPPYVFGGNAGISIKDKRRYKEMYVSGTGKINLFVLFIERASQLLASGGLVSYILPNTLLRVTSYDNIRSFMLKNMEIEEVLDLDVGVFAQVTASTIAIRLRNSEANGTWLTIIKHGIDDPEPKLFRQADWGANGSIIDIFSSQRDREILDQMEAGSEALGDLCHRIRFGVVISGNLDELVSTTKHGARWKPFLEGDEIGAYCLHYGGRFLNYDESLLHRSRTPDIFECRKIMIMRITGGQRPLKATLDDNHFYNKESILNLILKEEHRDKYEYILAVLNSRTANWFYRKRFTNDSKLTVNLSKEYIGKIPVKLPSPDNITCFTALVQMLLFAKQNNEVGPAQFIEDLIDACVMECYFPTHMAAHDLLFLHDLAPHLAAYEPSMSERRQRVFLTTFVRTLNEAASKIRNRLLRITADSPNLLAVIKAEI